MTLTPPLSITATVQSTHHRSFEAGVKFLCTALVRLFDFHYTELRRRACIYFIARAELYHDTYETNNPNRIFVGICLSTHKDATSFAFNLNLLTVDNGNGL